MDTQELHNITTVINALVAIKWALICIAVSLWSLIASYLLKEIPKWWRSCNKKRALNRMKRDLAAAERPRKQKVYRDVNQD